MKFLKRHLSLIIPLLAILFSIEAMLTITRIQEAYEVNLKKSYSIILAASRELKSDEILLRVSEFKSLNPISSESIVERLKGEISEENIERLKGTLPYYYSITLSEFPNQSRLESISATLREIKDVQRVESFSKAHDRIYRLLLILQGTIIAFGISLSIVSVLLMVKQIEVWYFEHSERMEIMTLLGAPGWLKNGLLFKLAIVDSIVASLFVTVIMLYMSLQSPIIAILSEVGAHTPVFFPQYDFFILLIFSLAIANISVFVVISRIAKSRNNV